MTEGPPEGPELSAGEIGVSGYDDVRLIGQGGFGNVYKAHQAAFDRLVAIKVLTVGNVSESAQARFDRECRAIGRLSGHPHIVTVYDSGMTAWGRPYIAMDYMAGGSFGDLISRSGPIGWERALGVGVKIAGALHTAHEAGILHRDVKPENILISGYGEPKLADFGISTIPGGYQTRSGVVTASLTHIAPEVLDGARATESSDLYALASTIYTLIAGSPPFVRDEDEGLHAVITRVMRDPIPDLRPQGVPKEMCALLERTTAKSPEERPSSAADFGRALQDLQREFNMPQTQMPVLGQAQTSAAPEDAAVTPSQTPREDLSVTPSQTPREEASATRLRARKELIPPPPAVVPTVPFWRRRVFVAVAVLLIAAMATAAIALTGGKDEPSLAGTVASPTPSPSSSPQIKRVKVRLTRFTYRKGNARFAGVLVSAKAVCMVHRGIEVKKVGPGEDESIGRARSGAAGSWHLTRHDMQGRFYAEAPLVKRAVTCESARSKQLAVKRTKRKHPGTVTTLPPSTTPTTVPPPSTTPTTQPATTQPPTTQPPTSTTCVNKPGPDPCDF